MQPTDIIDMILGFYVDQSTWDTSLVDCLLHPSGHAKKNPDANKETIQKRLTTLLSTNKSMYAIDQYMSDLAIGVLYFALDDIAKAKDFFKKAKAYPKQCAHYATDHLLKFPQALIDVCNFKLNDTTPAQRRPASTPDSVMRSSNDEPVKKFVACVYTGFKANELWRMYMDGKYQYSEDYLDLFEWESTEPNSMAAILEAHQYMLDNVDCKITVEHVQKINEIEMDNVEELNRPKQFVEPGVIRNLESINKHRSQGAIIRNDSSYLGISVGMNASLAGIAEIKASSPERLVARDNLSNKGTRIYSYQPLAADASGDNIRDELQSILDDYHCAIIDASGEEQKVLYAIVTAIRKIDRLHPFHDRNIMTCYVLLNQMLLQNKLSPTILHEPNNFDGYTVEQLVEQVQKGMVTFHYVKENGVYPGSVSTAEFIDKIRGGKHPRLQAERVEERLYDSLKKVVGVNNIDTICQFVRDGISLQALKIKYDPNNYCGLTDEMISVVSQQFDSTELHELVQDIKEKIKVRKKALDNKLKVKQLFLDSSVVNTPEVLAELLDSINKGIIINTHDLRFIIMSSLEENQYIIDAQGHRFYDELLEMVDALEEKQRDEAEDSRQPIPSSARA